MNLRLKLTILLGVVITITVLVSIFTDYATSRKALEKNAVQRLQRAVGLVSAQIEEEFGTLLQTVDIWAQTSIIQNAALDPKNDTAINQVYSLFARIVKRSAIFETFNLYNLQGILISSSTPSSVGRRSGENGVRDRKDFIAALKGKANIGGSLVEPSSDRPSIALSAPVMRKKRVIGVLRALIAVADFNKNFLKPLALRQGRKIFVFTPDLTFGKKLTPMDDSLVKELDIATRIQSIPEIFRIKNGIVNYPRKDIKRYAAFQWLRGPHAVVVMELPLREVFSPIRHIKSTAIATAMLMLGVVWFLAGMAIRPCLSDLQKCLQFVKSIRDGCIPDPINVKHHNDIAELALGLNEMAARLHRQRAALESSEAKYRSIFESAMEGIFQVSREGRFLAANPALAEILGVDSPDRLLTCSAGDFIADAEQRSALIKALQKSPEISNHEFDVKRFDGEIRRGLLVARAETDESGRLLMIRGILHDVTLERQAKVARENADKAEKLVVEARLKSLRYQVNPHFLYNAFNTIGGLSLTTPESIPRFVRELSTYFRYTLKSGARMWVVLREEIASIKSYLAIEQIRFNNHLDVEFDISPEAAGVHLPDMLFQPLAENAIRHGMRTSPMPLHLIVGAKVAEERLCLLVKNTGRWISEREPHPERSGIGLANLRERLEIFYGNQFSFVTSEETGWVTVEITLPLQASFSFPPRH